MVSTRALAIAIPVLVGSVLGCGQLDGTEEPVASRGDALDEAIWSEGPPMPEKRAFFTATLLPDGRVFVVGGWDGKNHLASTAILDPEARAWLDATSLPLARFRHSATLLDDGDVLVASGRRNTITFDATADHVAPSGAGAPTLVTLGAARSEHGAALLEDGRVLLAGGNDGQLAWSTLELVDPATGTSTAVAAAMQHGRTSPTVTRLPDGRVLIAGGADGVDSAAETPDTAEVFNPEDETFTPTGPMLHGRKNHTATLLADGRVLVVGGSHGAASVAGAEVFDPAQGTWSAVASLRDARSEHVAVLLSGGRVLVAGGRFTTGPGANAQEVPVLSAEIYDPKADTWTVAGELSVPRADAAIARTPGGEVFVMGGFRSKDLTSFQASVDVARDLGVACDGGGCLSGHCVDGVCCDSACDTDTCSVCAKARGASEDGVCTELSEEASGECRIACQSVADCPAPLTCDLDHFCAAPPSAESGVEGGCGLAPPIERGREWPGPVAAVLVVACAQRRRRGPLSAARARAS